MFIFADSLQYIMTSEELQESADLPQLAEKFKNNI